MEIKVMKDILVNNNLIAEENANLFKDKGVFVLNLMASPGAGKTSFILKTIDELISSFNIAVIEGDIASKIDAEKIKEKGIPAVQINTGGACHLDANMIKNSLEFLDFDKIDLLIIENVGNLVCPIEFKMGENLKVVILSIPEGDDKPLKYPAMFSESQVLILNKIDFLHLSNFDVDKLEERVKGLNHEVEIFKVSCKTGDGIKNWADWLRGEIYKVRLEGLKSKVK